MNRKPRKTNDIFKRLENFNRSKYPEFIKTILQENAFDSYSALKTLNKENISIIEQSLNENLDNLKEKLKDSVYLNSEGNFKRTPFKFLVGHVSLLLNIPNVIDKISSKNKSTTDSTNTDPVHLKKLLEKNIINHAAKKNIVFHLNVNQLIGEISNNSAGTVYRCRVKCPFCERKTLCTYSTCWKIGNYTKHYLSCNTTIVEQTVDKTSDNNINASAGVNTKSTSATIIERANKSDANKVLNEIETTLR